MTEQNFDNPTPEEPQSVGGQQQSQDNSQSGWQSGQGPAQSAGQNGQYSDQSAGQNAPRPDENGPQQAGPSGASANPANESVQQMRDGAKKFASGMKGYYDTNIAPVANETMAAAQAAAKQSREQKSVGPLISFGPIIISFAALLGTFSVFLPVTHYQGVYFTAMHEIAGGSGYYILFLNTLVAVVGSLAFVKKTPNLLTSAGVVGVLGTLYGLWQGPGSAVSLAAYGLPVGIGIILLSISSIGMLLGTVLTFLLMRERKQQELANPQGPVNHQRARNYQSPGNPQGPVNHQGPGNPGGPTPQV